MKTRSDFELSKKNGGIIRPKRIFFFSKHFWANPSGGFEGSQTFFENILQSLSLFIFSCGFPFHLLSSFLLRISLSSSLFFFIFSLFFLSPSLSLLHLVSALVLLLLSSLLLSRLSSCLVFHLLSSLYILVLSSCLVSSSLVFSCVVSLSLSSFSVFSLCLSLRVMLCVVLCGVCRCGRGECLVCVFVCCGTLKKTYNITYLASKIASVCTFKTSSCMPAPRAHVLKHMCAWCRYTR